jgi:uncharacterized membrane protein YdjX (TVP38/TMEM64 family)
MNAPDTKADKSLLRWAILGLLLCAAIIVPFVIWEETLAGLSRRWLESPSNAFALALVCALLLALDLFLPIPSSFVSAAAMAALGPAGGALAVASGMTVGALAGYALGRSGGSVLVERFVGRSELERAERLMARHGAAMLVVCRGVPVLAEASVVAAGAARMPYARFAWVTLAANFGLAAAYAFLSSFEASGVIAVITPFALGIAVPAVAIAIAKRLERTNAN